jgi:hypothetical protein
MGRPSRRSIFDVNSTQEPDPKVAGFRSPAQSPAALHVVAASLADRLDDPCFTFGRTAYAAIASIANRVPLSEPPPASGAVGGDTA